MFGNKLTVAGLLCASILNVYAQEISENKLTEIRTYKAGESIPIEYKSASTPKKSSENKTTEIRTYVAGESIPLGNISASNKNSQPVKTTEVRTYIAGESIPFGNISASNKNSQPVKTTEVRTYVAGESIPLGNISDSNKNTQLVKTTEIRTYVAGESIPISYPKEKSLIAKSSVIPLAGALGDSITTHIGVNVMGLKEANGLISTSPAGLLGLFAIKSGLVYYFEGQAPKTRKAGLKATAGIWSGLTFHNLLLIAGASNPVGWIGGSLFGMYMYKQEEKILNAEK